MEAQNETDDTELEWTTKRGADVAVRARDGKLYMDLNSDDVTLEDESTNLTREKGTDVLYAGRHKDDNGEPFDAYIPLTRSRKRTVEKMKEESEPDHEYSEEVQKTIEKAEKKGEKVKIDTQNAPCNDSSKQCNLDKVDRYATPDGELETNRRHTH